MPARPAASPGSWCATSTCRPTGRSARRSKDLSFEVRRGEIFGIAGVAGNGQNELFQALSGERAGRRRRHGACWTIAGSGASVPAAAAGLGLCCVPEERNGHAAVPDMSLAENALLSGRQRKRLAASGFIRAARRGASPRR